jgi:hypothetical protein
LLFEGGENNRSNSSARFKRNGTDWGDGCPDDDSRLLINAASLLENAFSQEE